MTPCASWIASAARGGQSGGIFNSQKADCRSFGESSTVILSTAEADALLSIAEAAEAWLERGSTLETHAALRAALAAVRKEEK